MNRLVLTGVAACAALLAACSKDVVVVAQIPGAEGQPVALADLPVRALPYDRDAIFDSLRAAYATPEPQVPADLAQLNDSIMRYREQWRTAETRWGLIRDSLASASKRLATLNRASADYRILFAAINPLYDEEQGLKRTMEAAFKRFSDLNTRADVRMQEIRLQREQWADAAYADFEDVKIARLKGVGLEELADTTDANGVARLRGLKKGQWWVHARYELPTEELYWNVPVQVGQTENVQLTPENAQKRPKL